MGKKPTIERWCQPDRLILIRNWAMWGDTKAAIAQKIGISTSTLSKWQKKDQRIDNALRNSQEVADSFVENALYKKAVGGDTNAMTMWLKARRPEHWNKGHLVNVESNQLDNEIKKLRIKEIEREQRKNDPSAFKGIPADAIAPPFIKMHHDIQAHGHYEYILPGGRGSTKSSIISLEIISLLEQNPTLHVVVCRMVADTMRNSVFNQMTWAIDKLGLTNDYRTTYTPLEITKKSTGQKIYFRGADDPGKLKSIAVPFGHIGMVWFEELDQFKGSEIVRKIEQSVIRGTDTSFVFKSFNPPKSKNNWANEYTRVKADDSNAMVVESCYTDVPPSWLGKPFIEQAEFLKEVNPHAYENEYLGVANGSGGNVFENIVARPISDSEIRSFDRVANGVDWGWYPDPFHFTRVQYNKAQSQLIIFDEVRATKTKNEDTVALLREHGITDRDLIVCDSAEPKSISDYLNAGLYARGAVKGPNSREYGFKWLASLREIVIDPKRTPYTYEEFINYEFERDDNGEIISGYPDGGDHSIDAVRYATEQFSGREATIKVG